MKNIRIGLLWHALGRPNLGVDALCRAHISILRTAAAKVDLQPTFVLFGIHGSVPPSEEGVEMGPYLRVRQLVSGQWEEYRSAAHRCNIMFDIGAGDGFTDIYGNFLFVMHATSKWIALQNGPPLVLAPQTIGPFRRAWTRAVATRILRGAKAVFARDGLSIKALQELKAEDQATEVIDVAFALPFTQADKSTNGRLGVGVNVSGLLFNHGDRFRLQMDYASFTRQLIIKLQKDLNADVWLVPHVIHDEPHSEDDWAVAQILAREFPDAKMSPRFHTAIEAKSFISGLDFFIGGRMHACIGAFSSGVPVIPIAYSRKFTGLFGTLGYKYLVDGRECSTELAIQKVLDGTAARAEMSADLVRGMAAARRRLSCYEEEICHLLAAVAAKQTPDKFVREEAARDVSIAGV